MTQYKTDCEIAHDEVQILQAELELTHKEQQELPWWQEKPSIVALVIFSFIAGIQIGN
jgi:hypothetical protein